MDLPYICAVNSYHLFVPTVYPTATESEEFTNLTEYMKGKGLPWWLRW